MEWVTTICTLGPGIAAGMIANPSDRALCKALGSLSHWLKQAKNQHGLPLNHDIQRAVRRAWLEATGFVAERFMEKELNVAVNLQKDYDKPEARQLANLLRRIDQELKALENAQYIPPDSAEIKEVEHLLALPERSARERLENFKARLIQAVIEEIRQWLPEIPDRFIRTLRDGGPHLDWFEVMCAFFNGILKHDPVVRAAVQDRILGQLASQDLSLEFESFVNGFESLSGEVLKNQALCQRIDRTVFEVLEINRRTEENTERILESSQRIEESNAEILEGSQRIEQKAEGIGETTRKIHDDVREIKTVIQAPAPTEPAETEPDYPCFSEQADHLPPTCPMPQRHDMPYLSINHFTGRIAELWEIHSLIKQGQTAVVQGKAGQARIGLLTGMGGIGKSQLAAEYVHRFAVCYPGGVFWVTVRDDAGESTEWEREAALAKMIAQLSDDAGIEVDTQLPQDKQLRQLWKGLARFGQVLLVYDNFPEKAPLRPWLPPAGEIYVLVTTRRCDLSGYCRVSLDTLSPEQGAALINSGERDFGESAQALSEALGGLPLALELARNYLHRKKTMDADRLLAAVQEKGEMGALAVFAKHYGDEMPTGHIPEVSRTIQLSYELASDLGREVLAVMAVLAPVPVPRRLLREVLFFNKKKKLFKIIKNIWKKLNKSNSPPEAVEIENPFEDAADELAELSLVNPDADGDPFLHRLIAGFVRTTAQLDADMGKRAVAAVLKEMRRVEDETDTDAYRELDKIAPHADILVGAEFTEPEQAADLSNYLWWHYQEKGVYGLSETYGFQALEIAQGHYEPGHKAIATIQSNLALVQQALGKYESAEALLREVVESAKKSYEPGHPQIALYQSNLATVQQDLGKYESAEALLHEVLQAEEKIYEPGHPRLAVTKSNLATVQKALGKYESAEALLHEVVDSMKKNYEPGHPHIAQAQSNLATVSYHLGKYESAEALLHEVLQAEEKIYEPGHPSLAVTKSNLALVQGDLGKYESAEALLHEVLQAKEKIYEPGHPSLATTKHNLATVLKDRGKDEEAIQFEREAYEIRLASLGPDHPYTKGSKRNLDKWQKSPKSPPA